jgi:predicted 2-oxoglutarate/Fe(II)-dependent dioxygenase YbiX
MTMPQFQRPTLAVQVGGLAPATLGMGHGGAFYSFEAQAGRPAVVILLGRLALADGLSLLTAFQRRAVDLAAREADVIALVDMQTPRAGQYSEATLDGVKIVFCEPDVFVRWGFGGYDPAVVVMDRAARVVAVIDAGEADAAETALAAVAALPREAPQAVILPAPVLHVPGIFSPAFCRELIAHFEASPHQVGGMAAIDAQGNAVHKIDAAKKHRNDFVLGPRDPYLSGVLNGLIRTVLPEMKKAFQIDACHTDRFVIARYDDAGGYFRRHRDNAAPAVAFRQFALSVNLNSEEYEGGDLLFPEYNSHRYKPGTGAGVVFSCSLLHEAAPVTKGRRYVLLTFLHNAEAQSRWLASTAKRG